MLRYVNITIRDEDITLRDVSITLRDEDITLCYVNITIRRRDILINYALVMSNCKSITCYIKIIKISPELTV